MHYPVMQISCSSAVTMGVNGCKCTVPLREGGGWGGLAYKKEQVVLVIPVGS